MELTLSRAIEFVRARLDELSFFNDDMISPATDDRNLDKTVEKLLPEAAEYVYRAAPADFLEPQGVIKANSVHPGAVIAGVESAVLSDDGVLTITIKYSSGFLRLVAFRASDSEIYVTEPVPFNSVKARMQACRFVRGTYDDPVLVEQRIPGKVIYRYYTCYTPGRDEEAAEYNGFELYKIDVPSYRTFAEIQDADDQSSGGSSGNEGAIEAPPLDDEVIEDEVFDDNAAEDTSENQGEEEEAGEEAEEEVGSEGTLPADDSEEASEDSEEQEEEEEQETGSGGNAEGGSQQEPEDQEHEEEEEEEEKYIFCPYRLELHVLNRLVGMVLDTYKETQLAQTFYQKSGNYTA